MPNTNKETDKEGKKESKKDMEKLKKERDEYLDGWKRTKADFINYKKEEEQRFIKMSQFSQENLIKDIIGVLDSFDLGLVSWKSETPEKKGMTLIRMKLQDIMKSHGLEAIKVKAGDTFDPSAAEAIALVDSEEPSGTIIEEVEQGYKLHGKVIRPARVKVAA